MTDVLIKKVNEDDGILLDLATTEFERMCDWRRVEKEVYVIKPLFLVDEGLELKTVAITPTAGASLVGARSPYKGE